MNQNTLRSRSEDENYLASNPQILADRNHIHANPRDAQKKLTEIFGKEQKSNQRHSESDLQMLAADDLGAASINGESLYHKFANFEEHSAASKASSEISQDTANEGKISAPAKNFIATPSTESQFEGKKSFINFGQHSGGNDNYVPLQNNSSGKKDLIKLMNNSYSYPQESQYNANQQMISTPQRLSAFSDSNYQSRNYLTLSDMNGNSERLRRSCRDKTTKYSLTHKGVFTNLRRQDIDNPKSQYLNQSLNQLSHSKGRDRLDSQSEMAHLENNEEQPQGSKSHKRATVRTAQECIEVFKNMLAFDWDLKDIVNLRHSPQQELTHSVFWFYVNCLYFPFRAQKVSELPFEEFAKPILQNLQPFNKNEELKSNEAQIQNEIQNPVVTETLQNDKKFSKFKKIFKDLSERALQESFKKQDVDNENSSKELVTNESETMIDEDSNLEKQQVQKFQTMIDLLQNEIEGISEYNYQQLLSQFQHFHEAYKKALTAEAKPDPVVYLPDQMFEYDQSFLAYIDPAFVQDIEQNFDWYLENYNEILLDVEYPSKQEKEFLKHIEQVQQRKNDLKYKKILKQIEQGKRGNQAIQIDDARYQNLSMHKRALVNQEDAQCAICNSGDYEDEDLIVFCGNCNVPVHQSCYGIDQLPEGDWLCYNCDIFGFKRGLLVGCLVCPRKGGAMKPTNIFTSKENQQRFSLQNGSSHSNNKRHSSSRKQQMNGNGDRSEGQKSQMQDREDKSLSLSVILKREFDFQSELRSKQEELQKQGHHQAYEIELHFDQNEKEKQIPEDYNFFLQRNEPRLESPFTPQTETLYEWVHLSCASWIPGPIVTPKTPVRLNKLDDKRFQLQCIICLKKDGACMQCQATRCTISFHVECARRANYCMEIERRERDKSYKMFCEKHRPLKIVKEMEEKDRLTVDEIQRFCKIIEKCLDIDQRAQLKQEKQTKEGGKEKIVNKEKGEVVKDKNKKWREKDKKILFERIKEKFLLFRKMRINLIRVDPFKKQKKSQQRKRSKKRQSKKMQHKGGCREGLRSKPASFLVPHNEPLELMSEKDANATEVNYDMNEDMKEEEEDLEVNNQDFQLNTEDYTHQEMHYKFNSPIFPPEIDWMITLSRNDFPWHEIKFNNFTAKECFEKYQSIVKDSQTFLKKVLGLKEKYKKMMQNQLQSTQQPQQIIIPLIGGGAYDSSVYCKCQGEVQSDFFVKCDGDDECPYGGWLHPQCTNDLKDRSREELETMEEWYCEGCVQRIQNEDEEDRLEAENNIDIDQQFQSNIMEDQNKKEDSGSQKIIVYLSQASNSSNFTA